MIAKQQFAFFDVDDTLIRIKSMFDFYRYWALEVHSSSEMLKAFESGFSQMRSENVSREVLNREYYQYFSGAWPSKLKKAGGAWAQERLEHPDQLFIPEACSELRRLRAGGVIPVFVSGSFEAVLEPIAKELSVTHILASQLQTTIEGSYTGELIGRQTIGEGKVVAITAFLEQHRARAADCLAFGDDISDLPMLEYVGTPVVVGATTPLATLAHSRNWTILQA